MSVHSMLTGTRPTRRALAALAFAGLLVVPADPSAAQQIRSPSVVSAGGHPTTPDLDLSDRSRLADSYFNLSAAEDVAYASIRHAGNFNFGVSNTGLADQVFGDPMSSAYLLADGPGGFGYYSQFFGIPLMAGTTRSTWQKYKDIIPSLQNIRNEDGYAAAMNGWVLGGFLNFSAADGTLGDLFAGTPSTTDGTCLDHSGFGGTFMEAGIPLLATSDCTATWTSGGFKGRRPINGDGWQDYLAAAGSDFSFDYWEVPAEFHNQGGFYGNFQTYGRISDYYSERLEDFGSVIPGGVGDPVLDGYPLGLTYDFDAFSFTLPSVANAIFWTAIITNNSADVYGTGIDYDSLYIGFSPQPINNSQDTGTYYEPENGAIRWVNNGINPDCNGAEAPSGVSGCFYGNAAAGFASHAAEMIVLKSPIGDLRNKHFSDPASPFYNPNHPLAGDTITFNHGHLCGYGGCYATTAGTGSARRTYGLLSSTPVNVLDGRTASSLSASTYWRTFHSADFPAQTGTFNRYVPGNWSYSNRPPGAPVGPDTLYLDSCLGSGSPDQACVTTFSDTLPGGLNNRYANVQTFSVGPFPLKAGEQTAITVAVLSAADSVTIEDMQRNVIDLYMNFYLSPQSPEALTIVAADVTPGSVQDAEVTLFFDDSSEDWQDPFLLDYHKKLTTAPTGTALAELRELNPWLADAVLAAASDNLEAIHVFKSCNGGTSFTADADCEGDDTVDPEGNPVGNGWQPATIISADAQGDLPNSWTDTEVLPGMTYLYTISAESKGAEFDVLTRDDSGQIVPEHLVIAPDLLAPLATASSEPNVATVYVPASIQAGGARATVAILPEGQEGPATVPFNELEVQLAGEPGAAATYSVVFFDAATVTTSSSGTTVSITRGEATESFESANPNVTTINAAGATSSTEGGVTTTEVAALGVLLVRQSDGAPLLLSTELEAGETTPGAFIARGDFPNFTLSVDNTVAGDFAEAFYVSAAGDTLLDRAAPSVAWDDDEAVQVAGPGAASGEYLVTWAGTPYGPQAPFTITFGSPATTSETVQASLNARAVAQTASVSPEIVELLRPVIVAEYTGGSFNQAAAQAAAALTVDDFVAAKLPFTVSNASFGRDVTVAMLARTTRARLDALADGLDPEGVALRVQTANEIPLGSGVDVQGGIAVPADTWIPGDPLYFVESVDGTPTSTFRTVTLACESEPRCNPVRGRGSSAYVPPEPGNQLVVRYYVPFTSASEFTVAVEPAVAGDEVVVGPGSLEDVLVVPNPYLGTSSFEVNAATESRVYFANVPPEGVIRIYSVSGAFLQEIRWTESDLRTFDATLQSQAGSEARARSSGDLAYNLRTLEGNELASGLYVFVIEAGGQKEIGKFVVIRSASQ